jgi:tRNA isopentenyl-2-thiomethyl-A-37 hydroxylase MiaE
MNTKLWLYVAKRSVESGGVRWIWMVKSRWYFFKPEGDKRFKVALEILERRGCPMVALGKSNRSSGYLLLKMTTIRDEIVRLVPDLLFPAYLSKERVYSLEELGWLAMEIDATPKIMALLVVGQKTKANGNFSDAKRMFEELVVEYERASGVKEK